MAWVEELQPGWVERHLAVYANVAGPTLGAPAAIPALLSGAATPTRLLHALCALVA